MLSRARFVLGRAMVCAIATLVVTSGSQAQHSEGTINGRTTSGLITSVPRTMSYQGVLKDSDGDLVRNTTLNVTFRIFDALTGGNQLPWTEVVQVTTDQRGNFTATLSDLNLPFDEDYYLELQIEGDPLPLEPRQKLHMVPYSARTDTSDFAFSSLGGGGWVDDGAVVRLETSTDNVGIGTASPQGKLDINGPLAVAGNVGTLGQVLKSQGLGVPPIWSPSTVGQNLSNVVFCWGLSDNQYFSTDPETYPERPTVTRAGLVTWEAPAYVPFLKSKFQKIEGISTVTFYVYIYARGGSGADPAGMRINFDIGGQSNTIDRTHTGEIFEGWQSCMVDVSGLANATVYDITVGVATDYGDPSPKGHLVLYHCIGIAN